MDRSHAEWPPDFADSIPVISRRRLPAHPALLGDELQVAVPLRRRGLGRGAGHGGRARRNDDVRVRLALGHVRAQRDVAVHPRPAPPPPLPAAPRLPTTALTRTSRSSRSVRAIWLSSRLKPRVLTRLKQ